MLLSARCTQVPHQAKTYGDIWTIQPTKTLPPNPKRNVNIHNVTLHNHIRLEGEKNKTNKNHNCKFQSWYHFIKYKKNTNRINLTNCEH